MQDVLSRDLGQERARAVFRDAGYLAGAEFAKNVLDTALPLGGFIAQLQETMRSMKMGILRMEAFDELTGALTLTVVYLKYMDAVKELKHASASMNKVILLQNKVKIRYVNNTNLLEYLYMKYGVESGSQLDRLWQQYKTEKVEREKMEAVEADLEFYSGELVKQLKKYRLFDPLVWTHQAAAILDNKEMVEVRHGLILRRQNLRKQMEYNAENAKAGQDEIKELVTAYPQYAKEVLEAVSAYEKRGQEPAR
jgi:hypothetical protein